MYTKQLRIAALAERFPQRAFTSLAYYIDALAKDGLPDDAQRRRRRDRCQTADGFVRDFEAEFHTQRRRAQKMLPSVGYSL